MTIKFSAIREPENWLKMIAEQFGKTIVDGELNIPAKYGEGVFREFYPAKWLTISYLNFRMKEPVNLERTPIDNAPYLPIMFYMNNMGQQILDNDVKNVGMHTSDGIFMPSSEIGSKWILPPNTWIKNLTLTFDRCWLMEELGEDNYICNLLSSSKSFYLFEAFNPSILEQIQMIEQLVDNKEITSKILLYGEAIKLFALFIEIVNQRSEGKSIYGIHSNDVKGIFEVRKVLLNNLTSPPQIPELAKIASMSPTKLQKYFKQIFGRNIYEFTLCQKMEVARKLLETKNYSVSEVGYRIGYSNLSHFTKAFNKHFNINPKNFLSQLL